MAAGTAADDAVNVSQLKAVANSVAESKTHYYSVNDNGAVGGNYNNDGATGANALAAGVNALATGNSSIAIGSGATASNLNVATADNNTIATAVGSGAQATKGGTVYGASASTSYGGVAIGNGANAGNGVSTNSLCTLFPNLPVCAGGYNERVNSNLAIGDNAVVRNDTAYRVALGTSSVAGDADLSSDAYSPTGKLDDIAGAVASGEVSVGNSTLYRRITNVAAGSADTDAVNVSQLKAVSASATQPLTFAGDSGTDVTRQLGQKVNIIGGADPDKLADGNIGVVADGTDKLTIKLAQNINLGSTGSVTMGNTLLNFNGLTIANGPSVTTTGIYAGDQKITGVKAGTEDTDAVNVSQLKAASSGAASTVSNTDGNITVTKSTNANGSTNYDVALADKVTMGSGDNAVTIDGTTGSITAGQVTVNGKDGTINGLTNTTWDVNKVVSGQAATEDQLKQVADGAKDYTDNKFNSITGDVTNLDGRVTTVENSVTNINQTLDKGLNFSADSGSAVNKKLGDTVAITGDGNIKTTTTGNGVQVTLNPNLDLGGNGSVTIGNTTVNNSGVTIQGGPSITTNGVDAGSKTITNVADGVNDSDAVNVGQMNRAIQNVGGNMQQLNGRIDNVENTANAGVAQAIATAGLPQAYQPGKSMLSVGGGYYKGETGYAVGYSTISDSGNWVIKATGSGNSRGHYGASVGAGYQW
ncbi:YadA family autotransporter adhesin [Snodgrassella sp. CFCC 13594]|uniref:YadA family autotransporter adhesin n=1 Tax=Snodgrassella sp. CFCC 13594 TaxID=1775559 RepID=UPI00082F3B98|nr:YadA-like family protein [Snodgrassella sp. CFCC 13594]